MIMSDSGKPYSHGTFYRHKTTKAPTTRNPDYFYDDVEEIKSESSETRKWLSTAWTSFVAYVNNLGPVYLFVYIVLYVTSIGTSILMVVWTIQRKCVKRKLEKAPLVDNEINASSAEGEGHTIHV